jgi:hypothetical protein
LSPCGDARVLERKPGADSLRNDGCFFDLLGGAQDLDLHGLPTQRALELPDHRVGLAQVARRNHIFIRLDGGGRPRFGVPLPAPNDAGDDVELPTELGHRLLARQDPWDRCPLELRAEDPSASCLPPVLAHGASRRIVRPRGEQSKGEQTRSIDTFEQWAFLIISLSGLHADVENCDDTS